MKKRDVIELWTYGTYEEESDTDFGLSFDVPKKWLKAKIKELGYKTFNEFYSDYTWDTTESILADAQLDKVVLNIKCGRFGHILWRG